MFRLNLNNKMASPNKSEQDFAGKTSHASTRLFIAISGLIGAGKTTLAEALSKEMGLPVCYEPVIGNEYLVDFYRDQKRYSFPLQIHLLNNRFRQQQQIIWSQKGAISDRSMYEDRIFAKILMEDQLMEEREYKTYIELFDSMTNFVRRPHLIIHLDVTPEKSLERIRGRERDCESGITLDYLQKLYKGYQEFIVEIAKEIPVIIVDWNKFGDVEKMAKAVVERYEKIKRVHSIELK